MASPLCPTCGEDDPKKFYDGKSHIRDCKKCHGIKTKANYLKHRKRFLNWRIENGFSMYGSQKKGKVWHKMKVEQKKSFEK